VVAIREAIMAVSGVRALHMLRTRRSGSDALVDVHIQVDPALSVSEGHQIGEAVRARLLENVEEVADVTVHIDPEDDEFASPCNQLPLRDEILRRLEQQWQMLDTMPVIDKVVLHYLNGEVHVDVFMPMSALAGGDRRGLSEAVITAAQQAEDIGRVRVYYQ